MAQGNECYWTARDLMNPKAVLWKLRFRPVEVSPDGGRVLGFATNAKGQSTGVVQVRRLRTGAVVRSIRPDCVDRGQDGLGRERSDLRATRHRHRLLPGALSIGVVMHQAQSISSSSALRVFKH